MSEYEPHWYQRLGQTGRKLNLAQRYYERGLDHFAHGRWPAALSDLDGALYHEPDNAEYYVVRGLILLQTNETDGAEEDFAHGLSLDSTQWIAYYGRGMRAYRDNSFAEALNQFSRAQHIAPERSEIYFHRAIVFYEMGNSLEAIRDMEFSQRLLSVGDTRHEQADTWIEVFTAALS